MKHNPIPKVIALILVSIGVAFLMLSFDASTLTKIDSMSPADYIQHQRELHQHSFVFHFVTFLILGSFYVGVVEFIAYLIGLVIPKKRDA
jgi:flagellar biosynthesis protein FlhB